MKEKEEENLFIELAKARGKKRRELLARFYMAALELALRKPENQEVCKKIKKE